MKKFTTSLFCMIFLSLMGLSAVYANDSERAFFSSLQGQWSGPGEIVAGKYKGTRFVCNFSGILDDIDIGMTLDGSCRVGVFSQLMTSIITKDVKGFTGTFNGGSKEAGFDITSGQVSTDNMVFQLSRKQLNGAMIARLIKKDRLNVTLSISVKNQLVPVVGITLKRNSKVPAKKIARK